MGAGNVCVFGDYEGLYYVDWNNFSDEYEDCSGEIVTDYDLQREEWEDFLYVFMEDMQKKFKSLITVNKWLSNSVKAILENDLFFIAVEDNQWSMAIKLLQKKQSYYDEGNISNLQKRHYQNYLKGIRECLFNQVQEIGTYKGAWTSGRLKKGEDK